MKVAVLQLCSSDDPAANLPHTRALVDRAADLGADLIATPEVTNCVSLSRRQQHAVLKPESHDETLLSLREQAAARHVWLLIGSLALRAGDADGRFVNRSFLVGPNGNIAAHYDKAHMFDVSLPDGSTYHESAGYRPGQRAMVVDTPLTTFGLTICYDLRFPLLFRTLAQAGARVITVPSAFAPITGTAHWQVLLQARAIEAGCFIVAPAQCGVHAAGDNRQCRQTWGHSLVVSPWGKVLADGGIKPGVSLVKIDLDEVIRARNAIPAVKTEVSFRAAWPRSQRGTHG